MVSRLLPSNLTVTRIALLLFVLICNQAYADVAGGLSASKRGDYATAFSEFSIAASKDDPVAQNLLGTMYAQGLGVERNYKLAFDWFQKAQALGSAEAMANLARMYAKGLGVPQNNTAALQYLGDAALAGFQPAILRMAEIYERGELGVAPDPTTALAWRARLHGAQAEVGIERVAPPKERKAMAKDEQPPVRKATTATLAKPTIADKAVGADVEKRELFAKQVLQRIEDYRQRERKLFVASTDETPSIAAYLQELRAQLTKRLATVFSAAKPGESMIVTLSILRDGTVRDIEMSRGSGNPKTDRKTLSSLKRLARLKPLPAEFLESADVLVVAVRLPIE